MLGSLKRRVDRLQHVLPALILVVTLAACSAPGPPAPGTPGIDTSTPLGVPSLTPATPILRRPTPSPTADVGLPAVIITNSQGIATRIYVEIADTPQKQETGLMHRTSMPAAQGMLFIFQGTTTVPFWMKDTLLPLSIAFITGEGHIIDLQDMQPQDLTLHNPAGPYTYALEVNQGTFARQGIAVGDWVRVPAFLPTPPPAPDSSP